MSKRKRRKVNPSKRKPKRIKATFRSNRDYLGTIHQYLQGFKQGGFLGTGFGFKASQIR